jgi:multidrug efflux pump subunit AcrA (membrane-fusion protein)
MATPVDLRQLAVERPPGGAAPVLRRRTWPLAWGLPLAIVAAFASLVAWSARDALLPARTVTVVPVILARADARAASEPLFQAAGWIEPRPLPVVASALVEGVVEQVLVIEGEEVEAGQPLARLVDADARLALQEAEAAVQLRAAERDAVQAALVAAEQHVKQPVHLEAALADADAALAALDTEIKNLPFALKAAESRLSLARQELEGKQSVAGAIAARAIQKAQSEYDAAVAEVEQLRERVPSLEAQREACSRKCAALRTILALKTDEQRAADEARAKLAAAEAQLAQARLAVESARLRLERLTVRSPIRGRVMSLHAWPGRRLMGLVAASEHDASSVATLYDPRALQVRADVRLEDVPRVQIGQRVQISTAAVSEPLSGRVLATTSRADIQKNTLSVKVAIDEPPPVVRPEMLAQVTFLAATEAAAPRQAGEAVRLLVPRELVASGDAGHALWVVEPERSVARLRLVQLGRDDAGPLVEATQGLSALDKLIVRGREGLADGQRIRVAGQDPDLGMRRARPAGNGAAAKATQP